MRIDDAGADFFRQHGYLVVRDFLSNDELEAGISDLSALFPAVADVTSAPDDYRDRVASGSVKLAATFPSLGGALNQQATHPDIIDFVERILGTSELELAAALALAKYGTLDVPKDQDLHYDWWGRNSIAYPRDDGIYGQIIFFIYYTNVTLDHAPTFIVSKQHTSELSLMDIVYFRGESPELYQLEEPVLVPPGALLAFSDTTLHRGSYVRDPAGHRLVTIATYHAAACRWREKQNWPSPDSWIPDDPAMREFLERATPKQRALLGFPAVGDPYWNAEMVTGVAARYPGMDVSPYEQG